MDTATHANGHMQKDVEQAVSNFLYKETRRRPMVLVNVLRS
jgi:mRNA degradation ribonuclease J1/J2